MPEHAGRMIKLMTENKLYSMFASCPKGVENLLQEELEQYGAEVRRQTVGGVFFAIDQVGIYQLCLYSRLANRLVLIMLQSTFSSADELYQQVCELDWPALFSAEKTLAVDFSGSNDVIRHGRFGAQRVKDAVVDCFNAVTGRRPSVELQDPDVRLYAHVRRNRLLVGVDVSGGSLHRRGYRLQGARAPLKENLAAALAWRAGLQQQDERVVIDPFCGSGTLLIEALMLSLSIAPGHWRDHFGFEHLAIHDAGLWHSCQEKARQQAQQAISRAATKAPLAIGYDRDARMVDAARANAARAGLDALLEFRQQALKDWQWPGKVPAIVLTNPPYGERLDNRDQLFSLYATLGKKLRSFMAGNQAWVLCSEDYLLKAIGLQKSRSYSFYNGAIAVQWAQFAIYQQKQGAEQKDDRFDEAVSMIENRLRKNEKNLRKWRKQQAIDCYRIYDADMPEYAFALDCYHDHFHMAEYAPPANIDPFAAYQRRLQFERAVRNVFSLSGNRLVFKQRMRQKGTGQYNKQDEQGHFFTVTEGSARVLVNLTDYLDTGLFLDHRPLRLYLYRMASGKRVLNLFCYTAVASVQAALGGASETLSVDMSQTYLDWAGRNFRKNSLDMNKHRLLRADVLKWLEQQTEAGAFDIIFLDPPSFSNSKRMDETLDIQRDHAGLVHQSMRLLAADGELLFSNNRRGFRLDKELENDYLVENITGQTIDRDFERNKKIHQCWRIRHKPQ